MIPLSTIKTGQGDLAFDARLRDLAQMTVAPTFIRLTDNRRVSVEDDRDMIDVRGLDMLNEYTLTSCSTSQMISPKELLTVSESALYSE